MSRSKTILAHSPFRRWGAYSPFRGWGALALLLLFSCHAEENISHKYLCRFAFTYGLHPTSKLVTAVKNPGYFVSVSMGRVNGLQHVYVSPADGTGDEDIALTTEPENSITYELGAYNGILLGSTNFSGPTAFDQQCPNCLEQYGRVGFPLTWVTAKALSVECKKCGRTYSLETGALENKKNNSEQGLLRYKVSVNAKQIVVSN